MFLTGNMLTKQEEESNESSIIEESIVELTTNNPDILTCTNYDILRSCFVFALIIVACFAVKLFNYQTIPLDDRLNAVLEEAYKTIFP